MGKSSLVKDGDAVSNLAIVVSEFSSHAAI
jgi:hypothetical protein